MKKLLIIFALPLFFAACTNNSSDTPYNADDFAAGGADAPIYNERTTTFMEPDNQYSNIDSYKPKTDAEKEVNKNRWNTSKMTTHWQEYRGTMVRTQILLGNSDMREMRLRIIQNGDGMDIDADSRVILSKVSDFEMKRVCGRNSDSIVIVYDNPSFDAMRPTPYFDYRVEAEGATMREYGFRCVYRN